MAQSIVQLPDMKIGMGDFYLEIKDHKPFRLTERGQKIIAWEDLSVFIIEVLRYHEGFFEDHEDSYPAVVEHCATELEYRDVVQKMASIYISRIDCTLEGIRKIVRRDQALRKYDRMFWNNFELAREFERRIDQSLLEIMDREHIGDYFTEFFRKSEGFSDLQENTSNKKNIQYMEQIDNMYWDKVKGILADIIKREKSRERA